MQEGLGLGFRVTLPSAQPGDSTSLQQCAFGIALPGNAFQRAGWLDLLALRLRRLDD